MPIRGNVEITEFAHQTPTRAGLGGCQSSRSKVREKQARRAVGVREIEVSRSRSQHRLSEAHSCERLELRLSMFRTSLTACNGIGGFEKQLRCGLENKKKRKRVFPPFMMPWSAFNGPEEMHRDGYINSSTSP
jgi:hypothetical protein